MTLDDLQKLFDQYVEDMGELVGGLVARIEYLESMMGCKNMKFMEPCRICKWCMAEQKRQVSETKPEDLPDGSEGSK